MSARKVLPIIVTVKSPDAPKDLLRAFATVEPGMYTNIDRWAECFEFETAEPFVIDLTGKYDPDMLVEEILEKIRRAKACGAVVAGMDFLRRAKILDGLYEKLRSSHLDLWGADLGGLPVTDLLLV